MLKILDRLEEVLIATLIAGATLIIFVAVMHRYLSGVAIPGLQEWLLELNMSWAQELTIIMFVWMAKFGAAYGVRTGIHVGVDVLINRLSDRKRGIFILVGLFSGALFTGIVATLGAHFVWENGAKYASYVWLGLDVSELYEGPITPDLEWPTWIVYSAIPLGSALMCFRFLQVAWNFQRTGELPHHDHSHVEGIEEEKVPTDVDWYGMDDDAHPHDLKHPKRDGYAPKGDKQ
ncbi:MAG: TRAP transporter small permease [Pseudomonadota bacterium]|nr:TRAP transporter small permease [Pseudomonadota bacterium]MDP1904375.1 TRAP transporter small permease [Pseudomonadota bacterium]MDP2353528.1 TRAP transporter small permease [Pseudomonadota bacterium]